MIQNAEYIEDYKLLVTFFDGLEKLIDLEQLIFNSTHPSTLKFKDKELFKVFHIDYDTICWGDNEFDINPMYAHRGDYDIGKKFKIKKTKYSFA